MRALILVAPVLACFGSWTGHGKFSETDLMPTTPQRKALIAFFLSMNPAVRIASVHPKMRVGTPVLSGDGKVVFGGNDWEEKQKAKTGSVGQYMATDTPDFFDEDNPNTPVEGANDISGSSGKGYGNENQKDAYQELNELLSSNDATVVGGDVEYNEKVDFVVPENAVVKELKIGMGAQVKISFMSKTKMFEDFYVGFTADSKGFSATPTTGTMDRKGGQPTEITVQCNVANSVGYLCFILPEMDFMSEYYKITCV